MLVLYRKEAERIIIGHDTTIEVVRIKGDAVKLGITAPASVAIHREEVYDAIAAKGGEVRGPGETQGTVSRWARETFPGGTPCSPRVVMRAFEEMCELAYAAGWDRLSIIEAVRKVARKEPDGGLYLGLPADPAKVRKEAGDVQVTLYNVADNYGFDLAESTDHVMSINRGRTWQARGDGTGYHTAKAPAELAPETGA